MKQKTNKILDSMLSEAMDAGATLFGGAGGGGSGTFSYTQMAGAKTWAPKSQSTRSTTADPQGYNVKDIGDEEAAFHHMAPKKRPFPLETIHDFLAEAYIQLTNAEMQLKACNKYNTVMELNMEKKALLKHLHRKTIAMKTMIKNMGEDLDRISFS
jgi:hypothetical protein